MKMRELERRTGVNREVIRIMIRKGLLPEPKRPARNAADYDEAHVRGVAAVRELQTNSRMTLAQIRQALDGNASAVSQGSSSFAHLDTLLAGLFGLETAPPVKLSSLEVRAPQARRDADAFHRLGMLELIEVGEDVDSALSGLDARLIDIWAEIRNAGFVEEAGFPPENIGFYLEAAEMVASREVEVFLGNRTGAIDEEGAARMLHVALPLMTDFLAVLRIKCFMRVLKNRLDEIPPAEARF